MPIDTQYLFELFERATKDVLAGSYCAFYKESGSELRLAASAAGNPCILVKVAAGGPAGPPVKLQNVSVAPGVKCNVRDPEGEQSSEELTIIEATTADPDLRQLFFRVVVPLAEAWGPAPSARVVNEAIERIISLFQVLTRPSSKTALGIWGELFVIATASKPELLVEAWRTDNEEVYDFSSGSERLEVKSSGGSRRAHSFSFDQVNVPPGTSCAILSVLTRGMAGGTTVRALSEKVRALVSSNAGLVQKVDDVLTRTLGRDFSAALSEAFDEQAARSFIRIFNASAIPAIRGPLPSGIEGVRFTSDLSSTPPAQKAEFSNSGLISSAFP